MAYIEKRKKGYLVRVVLGYDQNGKRIVKNEMYYPSAVSDNAQRKEVQKYADELERKVKNGELYNLHELSLNDFYKQWKEEIAPHYLSLSKQEQYENIMTRCFLPALGYMNISKITPLQLQSIVGVMGKKEKLKPSTIRSYFTVLSSVMHQAYNMGIIKENPVIRVTFPKVETDAEKIHTFTVEQSKTFLKALEGEYTFLYRDHERTLKSSGNTYSVPSYVQTVTISTMWKAYFTLALFSGARRGEMIALTWNDIDINKRTLSITKGTAITKNGQIIKDPKTKSGNREILLPLAVVTKLSDWKQEQQKYAEEIGSEWKGKTGISFEENYIFTQENGKQVSIYTPTHKFREILDMYNNSVPASEQLPIIKLHDLRHCTASLLISSGVDIAEVSRLLGHSKISMTLDRYTHALKGKSEEACNTLEQLLNVEEIEQRTRLMA